MTCLRIPGGLICGDFQRGGYIVLPVARARKWKWCVAWQGSSLWYEPNAVAFFERRGQAMLDWARREPRFTERERREWINKLMILEGLGKKEVES